MVQQYCLDIIRARASEREMAHGNQNINRIIPFFNFMICQKLSVQTSINDGLFAWPTFGNVTKVGPYLRGKKLYFGAILLLMSWGCYDWRYHSIKVYLNLVWESLEHYVDRLSIPDPISMPDLLILIALQICYWDRKVKCNTQWYSVHRCERLQSNMSTAFWMAVFLVEDLRGFTFNLSQFFFLSKRSC